MGKMSEAFIRVTTSKNKDDDLHLSTVSDIEDFVATITDFIDSDDIVGNAVMSYILANVDDIAETMNDMYLRNKRK